MVIDELILMLSGALLATVFFVGYIHSYRVGYKDGYKQSEVEHDIADNVKRKVLAEVKCEG